jgi:hypothetical protein
MRVRLEFPDAAERHEPSFVDMQSIPRVGEFLVSGNSGAQEVLKVTHTPESREQAVIIELGRVERG